MKQNKNNDAQDLGDIDQPLLVFGGPYSNLAAVEAMQQVASQKAIPADRIICTGDIVAYCADAEATTAQIQAWGIHCVMGNCEESLATGALDCGCGFEGDSACSLLSTSWYGYAVRQVTPEQCQWMGRLPRALRFTMAGRQFRVIHGGVDQINRFVFQGSGPEVFKQELEKTGEDIVIGGHSGLPFQYSHDNRYWLNAGVIGMPANDGTQDGWYMLLTPSESCADTPSKEKSIEVSWHRLSYDVTETQQRMIQAGLNTPYKDALATGLWPSMDVLPEDERSKQGQPLILALTVIC